MHARSHHLATAMLLAMLRTFLVFFIGGLLMTGAVVSLFLIGTTVWTDCLHANPIIHVEARCCSPQYRLSTAS
jgi:hypothetical protein